jgi:tetratricopeptide (TPR) repeat protein
MHTRSDFDIELDKIDQAIAEVELRAFAPPIDGEKATKYAYLVYQRASLIGDLAGFDAAEAAIERAIADLGPASDLYLLKANLDFKFHRLADVNRDLDTGRGLRHTTQGRALRADLDFQEGRYDDARRGYEAVIRDDLTWDNLARLAYLTWKLGDAAGADHLYLQAADQLTAKEMRHFAWVELQRGVLNLRQGRYEDALTHYDRADRAYSGYWLVDDHKAEWLGARGQVDEAAQLYERVIRRVPRPEFQQALGELCVLLGRPDRAAAWNQKALAAYLDSAQRGGVHYYHHLVDFYSDVREDGAEAVKWACKDLALRRNFSTLAALAWALYRAREFAEAMDTMDCALACGATDAHLFFQASMIYQSAGAHGKSARYLEAAATVNPDYASFHVHR